MKKTQFVILGAGRPHKGDSPAAIRSAAGGSSVLDWILSSVDRHIEKPPVFVAGYHAESIRSQAPDLEIVENRLWEDTGSAESLFCAPIDDCESLLVSYGDVLFRKETVEALMRTKDPISIGFDSVWKNRYAHRTYEDMKSCEKVIVKKGRVLRLGPDIPVDWADGEFVGLVFFRPEAVAMLRSLKQNPVHELKDSHLSGLLEYMRGAGFTIDPVDLRGNWAQIKDDRDIARFILGTKAETLQRLKGMVKKPVILDQISFTTREWSSEKKSIVKKIKLHLPDTPLVVRSSSLSEDSFSSSNAGAYTSVLGVDPETGIEEAVNRVIGSYGSRLSDDDQVLIQPMLKSVIMSGVIFTRTLAKGAPWYVINYTTSGDTDGITSGSSSDHLTLYIRRGTDLSLIEDENLRNLLEAVKEIEALLNYDALDIEFAVNISREINILQVRPISVQRKEDEINDELINNCIETAKDTWERLEHPSPSIPGGRPLYGIMPDWNPAEIIGTAPGALAESLYRYLIMDEVWAAQRAEYGYRDVRPHPLLVNFAGRPYVDVRASFTSFIPASVPDDLAGRLVNFYLNWLCRHPELHDKVEFEVVPTCLAAGFEDWEKRLTAEGDFTRDEVKQLREGLLHITHSAFFRCEKDMNSIAELEKRFKRIQAAENIDSIERAAILLEECRRFGTLPFAHLARSGFIAVTLLRRAQEKGIISSDAVNSFLSTVRTVSHDLTSDARAVSRGKMEWQEFVDKYGHLRPGTYEITSPRYDADPEKFLRPLIQHANEAGQKEENNRPWLEERGNFFRSMEKLGLPSDPVTVEDFLRSAIEGREYSKFIFSRNLSAALEYIGESGKNPGLSLNDISEIPIELLLTIRDARYANTDYGRNLHEFAATGRASRAVSLSCELPPLISGKKEFDLFYLGSDMPNFIGSSPVTAEPVDMSDSHIDSGVPVTGRIVMIPRADPGFDWLFGQGIAGLITLYGGANSHMAIRAAEFGLPAAIGVGEKRYKDLSSGRVIELDPPAKIVRVIR